MTSTKTNPLITRKQAGTLFDMGPVVPKERRKPRKLMHVVDAGPGCTADYATIVVMECNRCDLRTDWFQMRNVTEAKRGIECPRCSGKKFEVDKYGQYVVRGETE